MRIRHWAYTVPLRLGSLFRRGRVERELDEELQFHMERLMEEEIARGKSPEEARFAALRAMEGVEQQKERCRDARGVAFFDNLVRDVRYAGRMLRKNPGFSAVAVTCLALGVGANTAIFSLMNAVMLKSLPVNNPQELVLLNHREPKGMPKELRHGNSGYGSTSFAYGTFEHLRDHARRAAVFAFVPLGFDSQSVAVMIDGRASTAAGEMVSGEYFSTLGVVPLLGRAINRADEQAGAPNVAVISYGYWERRFGHNPSAVGKTVALNGIPFTIAGVTPPEFFGVNPGLSPDFWVALRDRPGLTPWGVQQGSGQSMFADRNWWWLMMMARRNQGVTDEQARAELDVLFGRSVTAGMTFQPKPADMPRIELEQAAGGIASLRRQFSKPLRILMVAVGLVLLIACANVAMLLLARAGARRKEMSIRLATGASRRSLIRQLLVESIVLAAAGGLLGLLLAGWGSDALAALMSMRSHPIPFDVRPDATAFLFCAAVSMLAGILFGLTPAFQATRVDLSSALKESAKALSPRLGLGSVLVAAQVALCLLLLVGAGLFVRTLSYLQGQDIGFDRRNLLVFALDARSGGATPERIMQTYNQVLQTIQELPGVRGATASQLALLTGWVNNGSISTDSAKETGARDKFVYWNMVGPSFFQTMGMQMVLGRDIDWRDIRGERRVAVVNEAMARKFFPGESPVGHHFNLGDRRAPENDFEIVGLVKNARYQSVQEAPPETAYLAYGTAARGLGNMNFEVRAQGDPAALVPAIRQVVRRVNPDLPLKNVRTQAEQMEESLQRERMFARLSTVFGLLALALVAVGLYGTLAYGVARRTNEIGIRMALGASRRQVVWMVLRQSLVMVAAGVAVGVPAALALTRFIASQLHGVKPNDALTMAGTVAVLAAVGALAAFLPACRAAGVAPTAALRYE